MSEGPDVDDRVLRALGLGLVLGAFLALAARVRRAGR